MPIETKIKPKIINKTTMMLVKPTNMDSGKIILRIINPKDTPKEIKKIIKPKLKINITGLSENEVMASTNKLILLKIL